MVGINPFAKKVKDPQLEMALIAEAQPVGSVVERVMKELGQLREQTRIRHVEARCGGRLKRNSIKQRTRLNRDRRNRERRYARYGASLSRNLVRAEYL